MSQLILGQKINLEGALKSFYEIISINFAINLCILVMFWIFFPSKVSKINNCRALFYSSGVKSREKYLYTFRFLRDHSGITFLAFLGPPTYVNINGTLITLLRVPYLCHFRSTSFVLPIRPKYHTLNRVIRVL